MSGSDPSVLLIEDDASIRRFLRASLPTQGWHLLEAGTAGEGLAMASSHQPDVILLDLGLPDMDGLEALDRLRAWSPTPVIILSARGQERDKIAGLDAGADDYLTKPFGVGELIARVRAALRRSAAGSAQPVETVVEIGDIRVDFERREVFARGQEARLTPIEFKLLATLVRHRGKVVTHRQLLKEVWGPSHVGQTHYLRIFILQLRRKLEEDPARPRWLMTELGVGYRLLDA